MPGKKALVINVWINERLRQAIIDTGSSHTLIREKAAKDMNLQFNQNRNVPVLQGVTGSPLRILGMVKVVIEAGNDWVLHRWIPVVPNRYLDADVLLGMDILGQVPFQYNGAHSQFVWRNTTYVVNHIKKTKA